MVIPLRSSATLAEAAVTATAGGGCITGRLISNVGLKQCRRKFIRASSSCSFQGEYYNKIETRRLYRYNLGASHLNRKNAVVASTTSTLRGVHSWTGTHSYSTNAENIAADMPSGIKVSDDDNTNNAKDLLQGYDLSNPHCNISPSIVQRLGYNLHLRTNHPLHTIKTKIEQYYLTTTTRTTQQQQQEQQKEIEGVTNFITFDDLSPVVSTEQNFDSLLIPSDHVSRSKSDTYYLDRDTVLRTHTSAHQTALLERGYNRFLVTGDVYRRDEIDMSHYPIFHQMEGVKMFTDEELLRGGITSRSSDEATAFVEHDLKRGLEGMAKALFGNVEMRWVDAYFPFTDPSFELEIHFADEWLEVLGCGVVHRDIVRSTGRGDQPGWAFGLGLERLAMVLFSIPDIRLFWTDDDRFHNQFRGGEIITFQPYSRYPPCLKDMSFWTSPGDADESSSSFHPNDLNEIVRDVAGDLVEKVELIDEFVHPKTKRLSNCFRISYRSMDRSLTNEEVDELQEAVRTTVVERLGVELR